MRLGGEPERKSERIGKVAKCRRKNVEKKMPKVVNVEKQNVESENVESNNAENTNSAYFIISFIEENYRSNLFRK